MKKADTAVETKLKKKQESTRGGKGRGRGSGRGRGNAQPTQVLYQTAPQQYQANGQTVTVPVVGNNGAANYITNPVVQVAPSPNKSLPAGYVLKPAGGYQKLPGPCYHCQGPHLQKHCPYYTQQTAAVQNQIETVYYNQ